MNQKRRMVLFYRLLQAQYEVTIESQAPKWIANLRHNAPHVKNDVSTFRTGRAETCMIFAPGASLTQYEEQIKTFRGEDVFIVGTPTVVPWMMDHKIPPDIVVAVDAHDDMHKWLKASRWRGPVLIPTTGNPKVAAEYPCWWFNIRTGKPGYVPLVDSVIFTQYPELSEIPSVGHVTGAALQLMFGLAHQGNANFQRFVLAGADYSYWHGLARVPLPEEGHVNNVVHGDTVTMDGYKTDTRMPFYKEKLGALLMENPQFPVYLLGGGMVSDFARPMSFRELHTAIAHNHFPAQYTNEMVRSAYMRYYLETMPAVLLPELIEKQDPVFVHLLRWVSRGRLYAKHSASTGRGGAPVGTDPGAGPRNDARDSGLPDGRDSDTARV